LRRSLRERGIEGAAIADWGIPDGKMFAMVFASESRTFGLHNFHLQPKHQNSFAYLKSRFQAGVRSTGNEHHRVGVRQGERNAWSGR
jgi:hypothetical protein